MMTRREYLKLSLAAGVALALKPSIMWADDKDLPLITRTIPGTDEKVPVVGLGSSATFRSVAEEGEYERLKEVFSRLAEHENSVFDTAPGYGASEEVAGRLVNELGVKDKIFWATKLNVAPRGGGSADREEAKQQLERSFDYVQKDPIDLIQVHNLGDVDTQVPILKEQKEEGRIRYLGVTTTFPRQYELLEDVMEKYELDFIGVDYAIDNHTMEERIFPMARDKGIGVLVYAPFGRTRLWEKVDGKEVPGWAAEFDAHTWGQFFLKWVVSNPVVTAATPATSRPRHMADNMGAALGKLPDEEMRERMVSYIDSL
ncbi:aryl-alcohol dehydrogenase-like predicted oxidoreductase [Natronospira proteinivora]|uniref:Aryl-alcohol dehydrogenase-like predicted oxidoreductase n=1 Tax=Natronospira proteinivora TaxID=1807133 RepID=A0ABT1G804_9GAMM|nr:aldo/keto reductase [Natronospira proteinivora]MCP1727430.1 aryl-alcohol dehydrogenase-like predicted oxidoreductase [Natronospira proteinivora]